MIKYIFGSGGVVASNEACGCGCGCGEQGQDYRRGLDSGLNPEVVQMEAQN